MLRELQPQLSMHLLLVNWYAVLDASAYFDVPGDHAGELETSVMLHLRPDLVRPLSEAGPGTERLARLDGMRRRWAWAPRPWTKVSADAGVGNPAAATADKGRRFTDAVAARLGGFLADLARADLERPLCLSGF